MKSALDWAPPRVAIRGGETFPVRHAWCVGRNYAAHAREMGAPLGEDPPIYFSKPAQSIVNKEEIPFPEATSELHHEVELVVFLGAGGRHLTVDQIPEIIFGYAVGVDLTRRDVQARARQAGAPWELAKGFDDAGPVGPVTRATDWTPADGLAIRLAVNGTVRQQAVMGEMLWPVPELLARLSREVTLHAGDVVFTGTPSGVAPLVPGDRVHARIEGLAALNFTIPGLP